MEYWNIEILEERNMGRRVEMRAWLKRGSAPLFHHSIIPTFPSYAALRYVPLCAS